MKAGNFRVKTDNPSEYLRQLLADYKSPRFDYLPSFTGGLVGYFSYDYLGYSEPSVRCDAEDTEEFKDIDLMLFDKVIAFDNLRQKIVLIANMLLDDVEVGYNKAVMELHKLIELLRHGKKKNEAGGRLLGEVTPLFDKEQFCGICTHGVLSPILVRPTEDGEYEIVSGHRRVFACRRLGLKEVPTIVQPMTREEAVLKMVDSNLHRERLLPSEKAFAYKMKLDAIKHRGKSLSQVATKSDSAAEVGAATGESRDMVFRYIRLTNLVPPLLDMVDEGKIALMPAERLSYLTEEEQLALVDIMEDLEVTPSLSQAVKLKDLSASHRLDPDTMYEVMEKPKANQRETVKLDADTLRRFFPDYTPKQMETAILRMLEEAERERQRQKILRRSRDDAR